MRTTGTIAEIREFLAGARSEPVTVGLVPTMGALHDGHLSLLTRAREQCDVVVVSLFVNPTQFDDPGDLASYPRDTQRDSELAAAAGADVLFAPAEGEMYRAGTRTTVRVADITETLEGASRGSAHFDAVATVVTKLLHIVAPDVAYFGQKDAQQVAVVRRLVADLDMAVRIEVCPIVRASDGVALSSRNMLLSADERERARGLNRALLAAQDHVAGGRRDASVLLDAARTELARMGLEPQYVELVDPDTMVPLAVLDRPGLLAIAARVGRVRLIDNALLVPPAGAEVSPSADSPAATSPSPTAT